LAAFETNVYFGDKKQYEGDKDLKGSVISMDGVMLNFFPTYLRSYGFSKTR